MYYLRIKNRKCEYMKRANLFGTTTRLEEAESFKSSEAAVKRKVLYVEALRGIDQIRDFDVVNDKSDKRLKKSKIR